jgi:hypothetical protein
MASVLMSTVIATITEAVVETGRTQAGVRVPPLNLSVVVVAARRAQMSVGQKWGVTVL